MKYMENENLFDLHIDKKERTFYNYSIKRKNPPSIHPNGVGAPLNTKWDSYVIQIKDLTSHNILSLDILRI